MNQIIKSLSFTSSLQEDEQYNLFEHDILLWCGDLNYRIDVESFQFCVDKIKNNKLAELREHDQLLIEKQRKNVFAEFEEAKIKFAPTYKYKVGTSDYEFKEKKP